MRLTCLALLLSLRLTQPAAAQLRPDQARVNRVLKEKSIALNSFSFRLFRSMAAEKGNANLFLSPYSVYASLSLASEGAAGTTRQEFRQLLGNPADSLAVPDANRMFFRLYTGAALPTFLKVANSVWVSRHFLLSDRFRHVATYQYGASAETIEFAPEATATLNKWVSKQTDGLIQQAVRPGQLNPQTSAVLLNAVLFKGEWKTPFARDHTQPKTFHTAPKKSRQVLMMHQTATFRYYEQPEFSALYLPYRGEAELLVLLPRERHGLPATEALLSAELLQKINREARKEEVVVGLPKFKLEAAYSVVQYLQRLGLKTPFSEQADFSQMLKAPAPIGITEILHQTYLEVDERKTLAAAATSTSFEYRSTGEDEPQQKQFLCDHPFAFLIVHRSSGNVYFIGRLAEPTAVKPGTN